MTTFLPPPTSQDPAMGCPSPKVCPPGPDSPPTSQDPATASPPPKAGPPGPDFALYAHLRLLSECHEDALKTRIALANRIGGKGVSDSQRDALGIPLSLVKSAEDALSRPMQRALREACPEAARWAKETLGIGEHTVARLLGAIGHPVIAQPYHWEGEGESRELVADPMFTRSVSQLWSYCGHGDPERRRRKGMTAEEAAATGNARAKMLVHLMAVCAVRCRRSRYRDTYDDAREVYDQREGWTPMHRHNAALRLVGKAILRDLWAACQVTS